MTTPTAPIRHAIPDDAPCTAFAPCPVGAYRRGWRIGAMTSATTTPTGPARWNGGTISEDSRTQR